MNALPYIRLFSNLISTVREMDDGMAGRLLKAALEYANGNEPEIGGAERFVWLMLRTQLDRDRTEYEDKCQSMSANGAKGGRPKKAKAFFGKQKKQLVFSESKKSNCFEEEEKEEEEAKEDIQEKEKEKEENSSDFVVVVRSDDDKRQSGKAELQQLCAEKLKGDAEEVIGFTDEMPVDLVTEAVRETLRHGGSTVKYTVNVLESWKRAGYRSLSDWRSAETVRRKTRNLPPTVMINRVPDEEDFEQEAFRMMSRKRAGG